MDKPMNMAVHNIHKPLEDADSDISKRADAVFGQPGYIQHLPNSVKDGIKTRLKMAEVAGVKVSEKTIADTFNNAATTIGLPERLLLTTGKYI